MEIAKLILEFLKVLAWPIVTFSVVFLFRAPLMGILARIHKANLPGGVSFDFHEEIQEAKYLSEAVVKQEENSQTMQKKTVGDLPSIPLTEANARIISLGLQPSPSGLDMTYYRELANQDPTVALAGLRIELEIIARNLAKGFKVELSKNESIGNVVRKLRDARAITTTQYELAQKILKICNAAIHGQFVSKEQADEVIDIANVLRDQVLSWLSWGFDDNWEPSKATKNRT